MSDAAFQHADDRLRLFNVVQASDPAELDSRSRLRDRLAGTSREYRYQLRDPALWRMRFDQPIFTLATRAVGGIVASHGEGRFATEVSIEGESDFFCITTLLRGGVTVIQRDAAATGTEARGLLFRTGLKTRLMISDDSQRTNVFLKATEVEAALEHALDARLRRPLEFRPELDWSQGLAASLQWQLDFVMREFARPGGVADNPVALATTTELLIALMLRGLPHNHAEQLAQDRGGAVPGYVHRAEEFMRANPATPLRIADVAAAAGCSVRTLTAVFRQFRGRSPLAALHAIRLQHAHDELSRDHEGSVAAVARRHGFTNASRFGTAFRRHFGVSPQEVARRGLRG
jgi:AraC-like DNA-binding protein